MRNTRTSPSARDRQMQWLRSADGFRNFREQITAILRHRFPRVPGDTIADSLGESFLLLRTKAPRHVADSEPMSRAWLLKTASRRILREILLQRQIVPISSSLLSGHDDIREHASYGTPPRDDAARHYDGGLTSDQWLSMLPVIVAEAVRMHVLEHYTVDEIAEHQHNSRDTIKKRLKQGYRQLRMIILRER